MARPQQIVECCGRHIISCPKCVRRRASNLDLAKLRGEIRKAVAGRYDLHVDNIQFLEPGGLPKTSSGKVQRYACRTGYRAARCGLEGTSADPFKKSRIGSSPELAT